MEETKFLGEHLLPGIIGRFSIFLAFSSALVACIAYTASTFFNQRPEDESWKRVGRFAFFTHGAALLGIVISLYVIIYNHYFEYQYAWQHSSKALPVKYIFACFWEGQEGSFLLWAFWHVVLGLILIFSSKKWEAPVMAVFAVTQVFLLSMLLGVHLGTYKLGSNPFLLLRNVMEAPIFSRPDYLTFVTDGNGLNPLLQNYWMVIHPPVLFMGFASTLVPFSFVIAALWKRDYKAWVKPALPWALFGAMILGVGILMGGAWAYESLTFGGFWAWDPVENASLVPWLCFVAGLHILVAYRSTGHGLVATIVLFVVTFLLILYSTFLTRSGILGDTSVHSFTDLGMSGQLLVFMFFYVILSLVLLVIRWKEVPSPEKEEKTSSREFWIFIGALVFAIAAVQITIYTSIPVIDKIKNGLRAFSLFKFLPADKIAPPTDPISKYNSFQVWIAILIGLLSGAIQYLRYRDTEWKRFAKSLVLSIVIALALTVLAVWGLEIYPAWYVLMLFSSFFAVVANFNYIITGLRGSLKLSGGSVAHIGFGLMLLGILISNHKQQVISKNLDNVAISENLKENQENILLNINEPKRMGNYVVTYIGDSVKEPYTYFKVHYAKLDETGKDTLEKFMLYPDVQFNARMGMSNNPDTRHKLTWDLYSFVTSVPKNKAGEAGRDTFTTQTVALGDTFYLNKSFAVVQNVDKEPVIPPDYYQQGDKGLGLEISLHTLSGQNYKAKPLLLVRGNELIHVPAVVEDLGVRLTVETLDLNPNNPNQVPKFVVGITQDMVGKFIVLKAIVFPYINALWIGCIIMAVGFVISIVRRVKEQRRNAKATI